MARDVRGMFNMSSAFGTNSQCGGCWIPGDEKKLGRQHNDIVMLLTEHSASAPKITDKLASVK